MNVQPNLNLLGRKAFNQERRLGSEKNVFPYLGLWLFTGSQGSGKTLMAMHCVSDIIRQYPEAMIVSNINIYGLNAIPYRGIKDFDKYHNGDKGIIFLIDEIHTLFSSLESAKMPVSTLTVWSQNRKNRRLILGTTQRFTRAAKGLREQTTWHYSCHRTFLSWLFRYQIVSGEDYDDDGKYIGDRQIPNHFYVPKVSVMRMYNTKEVVNREDFDNGNS